MRRAAIYARVSTVDRGQDPETQLRQLREYADRRAFTIVHEYVDRASGARNDPLIRLWPVLKTDVAQPAPTLPKTPTGTVLASPLQDVAFAGGGQFLVCRLKGEKGLFVYDTSKRQGKTLALPSAQFAFGAGGDTVLVALPKEKELHSYSLSTFKKQHAVDFQQADLVVAIVMGHSNSGCGGADRDSVDVRGTTAVAVR